MKHYGDITKINGASVEPVNVIIGGSPCQDLSVAGKQKGIKHTDNEDNETTRSGLFIEQLRIIKEMRRRDIEHGRTGEHIRPRFMVWENVPGAFSSNGGEDFASVLEETVRVVCEKAPYIPVPRSGWTSSGCLLGRQWSLAWRVLDAQFWGVPQRRKRIALVADFGGLAAPEILFEREGVHGNTEQGEQARKQTARTNGDAVKAANNSGVFPANIQSVTNTMGGDDDPAFTLRAAYSNGVAVLKHTAPPPVIAMTYRSFMTATEDVSNTLLAYGSSPQIVCYPEEKQKEATLP